MIIELQTHAHGYSHSHIQNLHRHIITCNHTQICLDCWPLSFLCLLSLKDESGGSDVYATQLIPTASPLVASPDNQSPCLGSLLPSFQTAMCPQGYFVFSLFWCPFSQVKLPLEGTMLPSPFCSMTSTPLELLETPSAPLHRACSTLCCPCVSPGERCSPDLFSSG